MSKKDPRGAVCRMISLALVAAQALLAAPAFAQEVHSFKVGTETSATAIQQLGQQSGLQILALGQDLAGKQLNPVTGSMTTDAALGKLLAGTGLSARYVGDRSVAIVSGNQPLTAAAPMDTQSTGSSAKEGKIDSSGAFRLAQESAGASADARQVETQASSASQSAPALEEVVVTAQKRSERLQDVPVSVSAVSGQSLEAIHATSLVDYAAYVPSLQVTSFLGQPGQVNLALRGITTGLTSSNQSVAIYVDDVPVGSSSIYAGGGSGGIDLLPYDVERIEVLEGPQGTLYGASSLGGLLKYVTREPNLQQTEFRAGIDGSDVYNATRAGYGVRASANVPLIPGELGFSLSASHSYTPGYVDNIATHERSFNSGRQDAARLAFLWNPTSQLSLELTALFNRSPFSGAAYIAADSVTGQPVAGRYDNADVEPDSNNVTTQLYVARVRYDMGWANLISVSGFSRMINSNQADGTSTFLPIFGDYAPFATDTDVKKFTQEIRFESPSNQTLQWTAGAFFTNEQAASQQVGLAITPSTNQPDPALNPLIVSIQPSRFREVSGFGNSTYKITDSWDVSAGLRYSHNEQSVAQTAYGALFGAPETNPIVTPFPQVSQSKVTYSVSSSYHLTPDQMFYARVATGYRPGGANMVAPGAAPTFGPDTTTNYEIGIKSEWLDRRLLVNLTQYYIDWKDTQVTGVTPLNLSYISNAGAAISRGTELTTKLTPLRGLSFGLNATYTNAVLTVDAPGLGGKRGDPLPSTPKFSGSLTAQLEHPLAHDLTGQVNAVWRYVGGRNTAFPGGGDFVSNSRLDAYNTLDLSAGVSRDHWTARLFARNIANKYVYLFVLPPGGPGAPASNAILQPRTVGLSLDVTF